jgi:hypothetical protein
MRNLANNIGSVVNGGGGNLPRGLETLIYERDKLERIKKYIYIGGTFGLLCTPQVTPVGEMFWKNKIGRPKRKWDKIDTC